MPISFPKLCDCIYIKRVPKAQKYVPKISNNRTLKFVTHDAMLPAGSAVVNFHMGAQDVKVYDKVHLNKVTDSRTPYIPVRPRHTTSQRCSGSNHISDPVHLFWGQSPSPPFSSLPFPSLPSLLLSSRSPLPPLRKEVAAKSS